MSESRLFEVKHGDGKIFLIYQANENSMPADEFGKAIVGFESCLREAAKIGLLYHEGIFIEPIEVGSVRSVFKYVKKNPLAVVVAIDLVVNLFNNSFQLIDRFGADSFKNPHKEILEQVTDKKILELCRSFEFRNGLQKVAEPVSDLNQEAEIIIGENNLKITCKNKYQFYVNKEDSPVLPNLVNGEEVFISGEITRINKRLNDIGFLYDGYTLNISPIDKEKSVALFHEFLDTDKASVRGIVIRDSEFQVPKIKVLDIEKYNNPQASLLDNK